MNAIYKPEQFLLIAGPCALENESVCRTVAEELKKLEAEYSELNILFKGSFDKANRTSLHSQRGPGLEQGIYMLETIKNEYQLRCTTDIHLPDQAGALTSVVDVIQIPAFLCRQTDLLQAAAETGCVVNVKKGQFLSPYEAKHIVEKLRGLEASEIWLTERGTLFGYQNLVVDMRSFSIMKAFDVPAIFDATHSVQLPGAGDGKTIGQRQFIPALARAAIAAGADGVFCETHPNPDEAISDAANQIPVAHLKELVDNLLRTWQAIRPQGEYEGSAAIPVPVESL